MARIIMKTHLQRRIENTELVYRKEINKAGYEKKAYALTSEALGTSVL